MLRFWLFLILLSLQAMASHSASAAQATVYSELETLLTRGKFEQAIARVEPLLAESPGDARLHYYLGKALIESVGSVSLFRKLAHARRGRESLERAVRLDPLQVEARKELSDYYYYAPSIAGGSKSRSAEFLEQIREISPYRFYLYRGEYQISEGEWQSAKQSYEQAQQLEPQESSPLLQLGIVNRQLQRYEEARVSLQRALELNADESMAYFYLGLLGLSHERFASAGIEAFEHYIELVSGGDGPYLDQVHFRLGQLWQRLDNDENAAANFRRAIELRPDYAAAMDALDAL